MGHGIAGLHAAQGSQVTVIEPNSATRESLRRRLLNSFAPLDVADEVVRNTTVSADPEAMIGSDLIVEAASEQLDLKISILRTASQHAPQAIFATNTSALRISDIAGAHVNPSLVVGTHFFNPPHLIPLVEVVPGERTAKSTIRLVANHLRSLGKQPAVLSSDPPGFVANRIQHAMWREALDLLDKGVADAQTIDMIVRNSFGARLSVMGPIENADYVGLDLVAEIHNYLFPSLSNRHQVSDAISNALGAGNLGRKTGQGLSSWSEEQTQRSTDTLSKHLIDQFFTEGTE